MAGKLSVSLKLALPRNCVHAECDQAKMLLVSSQLQCLDAVLSIAATSSLDPFVGSITYRDEVRAARTSFARGTLLRYVW